MCGNGNILPWFPDHRGSCAPKRNRALVAIHPNSTRIPLRSGSAAATFLPQPPAPVQITHLLSPRTIRVNVNAESKTDLIGQALDLLADSDKVTDLEEVRQVVLEREEAMSTGVGKGLGLPHGKTTAMKGSAAALLVTRDPVDFDAFDGEPVRIVFLLVGPPEAQTVHIRTLSRISRLINDADIRRQVLEAQSPKAVFDLLQEAEISILGA